MASVREENSGGGNYINSFVSFLKDCSEETEETDMGQASETNGKASIPSKEDEDTKDSQMSNQSETDSNNSSKKSRKRRRIMTIDENKVRDTPRRTTRSVKRYNTEEDEDSGDVDDPKDPGLDLSDSDDDPDFDPSCDNAQPNNVESWVRKGKRSQRRSKSIGNTSLPTTPVDENEESNCVSSSVNLSDAATDDNSSHNSDSIPKRRGRPPVYQTVVPTSSPATEISDDAVSSSTVDTVKMSANKLSSAYNYSASRSRQNQAIRLPEGPNLTEEQLKIIESQFKSGDFVMGKKDVDLDDPPIWRIDGKSLLQKFQAFEKDGKTLYRNISTYSGWTTQAKALYVPVKVNFVFQSRYDTVVELIGFKDIDGNSQEPIDGAVEKQVLGSKVKELDIASTMKLHMPSFEIYLQTLISQALDYNFLHEIYEENDTYFLERLNIIDSMITERKEKVKKLAKWNDKFQNSLDAWPCVNSMITKHASECQACEANKATRLSQFYGQPYDARTLRSKEPTSLVLGNKNFETCDTCSVLCQLYNKVVHQKYDFYSQCKSTVTNVRVSQPNKSTTNILRDLLANDYWISGLFRNMCTAWSKVDSAYEDHLSVLQSNSSSQSNSCSKDGANGESTATAPKETNTTS